MSDFGRSTIGSDLVKTTLTQVKLNRCNCFEVYTQKKIVRQMSIKISVIVQWCNVGGADAKNYIDLCLMTADVLLVLNSNIRPNSTPF